MRNDLEIINEAIRLVNKGIAVTLPVNGYSMLPFIVGGRDRVTLIRADHIKCGDIVLAWANNTHYVIHRILNIEGDYITLMGDGNLNGKEHCMRKDIMARATHVVNDSGTTYLYDRKHRTEAVIWQKLRPIRKYLLAIYKYL